MWIGLRKAKPRASDGKYSLVGDDCGISHKGSGSVDMIRVIHGPSDQDPHGTAGTSFDGLEPPPFRNVV